MAVVRTALDLAIPPTCLVCDTITVERGGCCSNCWKNIHFITRPYCEISGTPFAFDQGAGSLSPETIANPPRYRRCRSAVVYDDISRRMVTSLKYGDRLDLAPWMATWMVRAGSELFEKTNAIVPVALHRSRHLRRRFNQAAELARHIAADKKLPYHPYALVRHRATLPQVGLNRLQRERNLQGAFRVPDDRRHEVAGKNILLVDDVFTSGATVEAAVRALIRGGATEVDVIAFARAGKIIEG